MLRASRVLPSPCAATRTRFSRFRTSSPDRARSRAGRSMWVGQFQSNSSIGLKRPSFASPRRRSRERRSRSAVSCRTSSSSTTRALQRCLVARARKSSRSSAVRGRRKACSCEASSVLCVVVEAGERIVGLQVVGGDVQAADVRARGQLEGDSGEQALRALPLLEPQGHRGGGRRAAAQGLGQSRIGRLGAVVVEQPDELAGRVGQREPALHDGFEKNLGVGQRGAEPVRSLGSPRGLLEGDQGLEGAGVFDALAPVVAARVPRDLGLAIEDADPFGGGDEGRGLGGGARGGGGGGGGAGGGGGRRRGGGGRRRSDRGESGSVARRVPSRCRGRRRRVAAGSGSDRRARAGGDETGSRCRGARGRRS